MVYTSDSTVDIYTYYYFVIDCNINIIKKVETYSIADIN